eukprot:981783_1
MTTITLCGLQNQGATCYLNALIQTLFLTPEFRMALFSLSESEVYFKLKKQQKIKKVIIIEMQKLFARLQSPHLFGSNCAFSTKRLTDAFGWNANQVMEQHDINELFNLLLEGLEQQMPIDKKILNKYYRGSTINVTECTQCQYTSKIEEEFTQLNLIMQNMNETFHNLEDSLISTYLDGEEELKNENAYLCPKCNKKQPAVKYCRLNRLPTVLVCNFNRFYYDLKEQRRVKINRRFTFKYELSLNEYKYELSAVVVHGGNGAKKGHYHAYVRDWNDEAEWNPIRRKKKKKQTKRSANHNKNTNNKYDDREQRKREKKDEATAILVSILREHQILGRNTLYRYYKQNSASVPSEELEGGFAQFVRNNERFSIINGDQRRFSVCLASSCAKHTSSCVTAESSSCVTAESSSCDPKGWHHFNDRIVSPCLGITIKKLMAGILDSTPYMVFYRRVCTKSSQSSLSHTQPQEQHPIFDATNETSNSHSNPINNSASYDSTTATVSNPYLDNELVKNPIKSEEYDLRIEASTNPSQASHQSVFGVSNEASRSQRAEFDMNQSVSYDSKHMDDNTTDQSASPIVPSWPPDIPMYLSNLLINEPLDAEDDGQEIDIAIIKLSDKLNNKARSKRKRTFEEMTENDTNDITSSTLSHHAHASKKRKLSNHAQPSISISNHIVNTHILTSSLINRKHKGKVQSEHLEGISMKKGDTVGELYRRVSEWSGIRLRSLSIVCEGESLIRNAKVMDLSTCDKDTKLKHMAMSGILIWDSSRIESSSILIWREENYRIDYKIKLHPDEKIYTDYASGAEKVRSIQKRMCIQHKIRPEEYELRGAKRNWTPTRKLDIDKKLDIYKKTGLQKMILVPIGWTAGWRLISIFAQRQWLVPRELKEDEELKEDDGLDIYPCNSTLLVQYPCNRTSTGQQIKQRIIEEKELNIDPSQIRICIQNQNGNRIKWHIVSGDKPIGAQSGKCCVELSSSDDTEYGNKGSGKVLIFVHKKIESEGDDKSKCAKYGPRHEIELSEIQRTKRDALKAKIMEELAIAKGQKITLANRNIKTHVWTILKKKTFKTKLYDRDIVAVSMHPVSVSKQFQTEYDRQIVASMQPDEPSININFDGETTAVVSNKNDAEDDDEETTAAAVSNPYLDSQLITTNLQNKSFEQMHANNRNQSNGFNVDVQRDANDTTVSREYDSEATLSEYEEDSIVLSSFNAKDDKRNTEMNHSRRNSIESIKDVSSKENTSQSVSLLVDPVSSPLVSSTHRGEFETYLQRLSSALDLNEIAFNLDEFAAAICSVSYEVFQNANDRIARENKHLEEEYKQYYDDQTEMLLLKLQKHQNNHNKCVSETQSTQNKLLSKQDKQRNKFKSIVNDQLQILQLTQELNDDTQNNIQPQPLPLPQDEFYLYREEMDKAYLERVKQFETKQKKELDSFRKDLGELKQLRLEVRKKNLSKMMTSNPSSPLRSPRPQLQFEDRSFTLSNNAPKHVNRASHSSAPHTQQIDILTGLDLKLINDANDMKPQAPLIQSNVNDAASTAMRHYHSSSLPLGIEHQHPKTHNTLNTIATTPHATCAPQSKFKVSHVNNAQIHKQAMHAMHTTQHTHHSLPHSNK